MPGGGPVSAGQGGQQYAFMPTGPTQQVTLGNSTKTVTLTQWTTTYPYAPQCAFWNIGAAAANSLAYVLFDTVGATITTGTPIVPIGSMVPAGSMNDTGLQILTTGKSPNPFLTIGSTGTTTVFITPGEGSR